MIELQNIHEALVRLSDSAVGNLLSSTPGAVIKENQNKQKPKYPYIAISYPDIKDEDGWQLEEMVNATDEITSVTVKHLGFNISCFGDNAVGILNTLQAYLRRAYVRDALRKDFSVGIVGWGEVRSLPRVIGDMNFTQTAEFVLTLNVPDVDVISDADNNHLIEGVDLTGELYRHETDSEPLTIEVQILPEGD